MSDTDRMLMDEINKGKKKSREIAALRAERDRLRGALKAIKDYDDHGSPYCGYYCDCSEVRKDIAARALTTETEPQPTKGE